MRGRSLPARVVLPPAPGPSRLKIGLAMLAKAIGFPISTTYSLTDPALATLLSSNYSSAGVAVTEATALQDPTVLGCVRVISETIGSLPVKVYTLDDDGDAVEAPGHPVARLLAQPNDLMTGVEYTETKATNLALWGNGYSLKEDVRSDGSVVSLMPIASSLVNPRRNDAGGLTYDVNDRGKVVPYPAEKVWHVKGISTGGLVGYSPLGYARQTIGLSLATQELQSKFFANGAMPSYFVSIAKWLNPNERQKALENLNQLWGGVENAYRAQLLEGGMTAAPAMLPLEDAQFMQLKKLTALDICRFYRMPPHMVGILDQATNNNIEHQALEFVMYTLRPWLTRIEASANRWLFSKEDRGRFFVRFDVDDLLRADSAARSELYSTYVQNGILSRNEVRALEKMGDVDDPAMDAYTVQVNLTPIDQLASVSQAIAAAKKPGAAPPAAATSEPAKVAPAAGETRIVNDFGAFRGLADRVAAALGAISETQKRVSLVAEQLSQTQAEVAAASSEAADGSARLIVEQRGVAKRLAAVVDSVERAAQESRKAAEALGRPRQLVRDRDGNAVGTVAVDKLKETQG